MEGDLTKKWHWEEEVYQTVELDRGGSNLEVALGGGLPDIGTRWRGI